MSLRQSFMYGKYILVFVEYMRFAMIYLHSLLTDMTDTKVRKYLAERKGYKKKKFPKTKKINIRLYHIRWIQLIITQYRNMTRLKKKNIKEKIMSHLPPVNSSINVMEKKRI